MYDDAFLMEVEQQRAELRKAEQSIDNTVDQCGVMGLALLPAAVVAGVLIATLQLILEQQQARMEARRLEDLLLDAGRRAPKGIIMPTEKMLEVYGNGRADYR